MTKKIDQLAALRGCSVGAMIMVATNLGDGKAAAAKVQEKSIDQTEHIIKTPQKPLIDDRNPDLPPDTIAPFRVMETTPQMSEEQSPNKAPAAIKSQEPVDNNFDLNNDNSDYIEACKTFVHAYENRDNPGDSGNPTTPYDKNDLLELAISIKLQKNIDDMTPVTQGLTKLAEDLDKIADGNLDAKDMKEIARESKKNYSKTSVASAEIIGNFQEDLKIFTEISKDPEGKAADKFLDKSHKDAKKALSANDKEEKKMDSKTANQTPLSYAASKRMQNTY